MRRAALVLIAAALAGCAAPRGAALEHACPGPPMSLDVAPTGTVVVAPPVGG